MPVSYNVEQMKADTRAKGWTDTKLAKAARLAQFTVSRIFRGSQPSPTSAAKIAKALGQPLEKYVVVEEAAAVNS